MSAKRIVVMGAGESGTGAAFLAAKQGFDVFVTDIGQIEEKYKNVLLKAEIEFEEGKHSEARIYTADEVIKSPGIPDDNQVMIKVRQNGIPVISEIEFGSRYTNAHKTCITGSNGKTTTTLLTHHILKNAGYNAGLAGNVGKSFAYSVATEKHDFYVLEISSFQLDGMHDFKAETAILMNITPDHLDRYEHKFENYMNSKFRICRNQGKDDAFIYCADDLVIRNWINNNEFLSRLHPFSIIDIPPGESAYIKEKQLVINIPPRTFTMTLEALALQGKHNIYNSMAAGIAARVLDIRKDTIKESLSDFQNIEHRLESVANIHGIEFINDSKATNINSTWYALESMQKPVIWIVGGIDKGNDYSILEEIVLQKVKAIICLGVDNAKIVGTFYGKVDFVYETLSMEDAVNMAYSLGKPGDVALLSPACASFDLFKNYEERGNKFKEAVKAL